MEEKKMEDELKCALWAATSKKGINYYKGKININGERYFVSLLIGNKKIENGPDFNLIITKSFSRSKKEEKEETKKEEIKNDIYQPLVFNEPKKEEIKPASFETETTQNVFMQDFSLSEDDLPF